MLDGISNIRTYTPETQKEGTGKSVMGKDDFMKLMIAQLKYQDPMNPMNSDQYASQLAQFSSLEQLQNMNKSLDNSLNANFQLAQSVNNTMSTALIGKEVKLAGSTVNYQGQSEIEFAYKVPADAKSVKIDICNEAGLVIKSINCEETLKGEYSVKWDFTNNLGKKVDNANYTIKIEAIGLNGSELSANLYKVGKVDSLRFTDKGSVVVINGQEYPLSEVYEIFDAPSEGA